MPRDHSKELEHIKDVTQISCYMHDMQYNKNDIFDPKDSHGMYSLLDQHINYFTDSFLNNNDCIDDFNILYNAVCDLNEQTKDIESDSHLNKVKRPSFGITDMGSRFLQICHTRLPDDHVAKKWAQNKIMNKLADALSDLAEETRENPKGMIKKTIQILDALKNNKEYQIADVSGIPLITFYGIEENLLDIALSGIHRLLIENEHMTALPQAKRRTIANALAQAANKFVSYQNAGKDNGGVDEGYIVKFTNAYEKFRTPRP